MKKGLFVKIGVLTAFLLVSGATLLPAEDAETADYDLLSDQVSQGGGAAASSNYDLSVVVVGQGLDAQGQTSGNYEVVSLSGVDESDETPVEVSGFVIE